MISFKTLC